MSFLGVFVGSKTFARCASAAAFFAFLSAGAASASTVDLDFTGFQPGPQAVYYTFDETPGGASAGQFAFEVDGGSDTLLAWCIDLAHTLIQTKTPYTHNASLLQPAVIGKLDRLFTQHYAKVVDAITAAAFQIAVWEYVYDTDGDLSEGRFKLSSTTAEAVAVEAAEFVTLGSESGGYTLTFLQSTPASGAKSQDLVTATPIPLPAAGWMLLAGLAGLAAARRRS